MQHTFILPNGDQTRRGEEVASPGTDWECGRITFIKDRRNLLVLHFSSGRKWVSILEPSVTNPATYRVFTIDERADVSLDSDDHRVRLRCTDLIEFEVKDPAKAVR